MPSSDSSNPYVDAAVSGFGGAVVGAASGAILGPGGMALGTMAGAVGGVAVARYAPSATAITRRISEYHLVRSLLEKKFDSELRTAFIFDRVRFFAELAHALVRLKEADVIADRANDERLPTEEWEIREGLIPVDQLADDARLLASYGRISINVSTINVSSVAALVSLQSRFGEEYGLVLDVRFQDINGREQMRTIFAGESCDFTIAPIDAFFLSECDGSTQYRVLGPITGESQCVFRKKSTQSRRASLVHTFDHSAAEMNHRLGVGVPKSAEPEPILDSRIIPHLIEDIAGGDFVIAWDPLAVLLRRDRRYEEMPGSSYCVTYFLFCNKSWRRSDRNRLRNAFKRLFVNEWWYCKSHRRRVLRIVRRRHGYMDRFANAVGLKWTVELGR